MPAGESETGSVSSGGGGGVDFLPVNSQLNKVCAGAGGRQRSLACCGAASRLQATVLLAVTGCVHSGVWGLHLPPACHLLAVQVMFYV